jgi:hypothetical protein
MDALTIETAKQLIATPSKKSRWLLQRLPGDSSIEFRQRCVVELVIIPFGVPQK